MMMLFKLVGGGKGVALIMLFLSISGFIGYQQMQISSLEHDVRTLELTVREKEIEITRLNGEVSQCRATMEITNDRISDLKETRDMQKQNFQLLTENLEAFKTVSSIQIQEIESVEAPDSCDNIMIFLRNGVGS